MWKRTETFERYIIAIYDYCMDILKLRKLSGGVTCNVNSLTDQVQDVRSSAIFPSNHR